MSNRTASLLVGDILDSAAKILEYTKGLTFEEFISDGKTIDAVVRNFEIIGEASSRLPENFRNKHPEINWSRIKGFRNRIVHNYFGLDNSIIWEIKDRFLPDLIIQLKQIPL